MPFRKAKGEQAALKMGAYGPSGSGKTFTSLLIAEGLAGISKKRIAFVDTERGTDFYAQSVPERTVHPEAFDFDALYTRSITETLNEIKGLSDGDYGVVVIDSITHLWEAAIAAYSGKRTKGDTIPFHAWGAIKRPYKALIQHLLNAPYHVIICGRQGNEFSEDDNTGELKRVGFKMKAEGETPYEPHILVRMEAIKGKDSTVISSYVEKDRTGILAGKVIYSPTFETLGKPFLRVLGGVQAQMDNADEVAVQDAESLSADDAVRESRSAELLEHYQARLRLADDWKTVEEIGSDIKRDKKLMVPSDVSDLRETFLAAQDKHPKPKKGK